MGARSLPNLYSNRMKKCHATRTPDARVTIAVAFPAVTSL